MVIHLRTKYNLSLLKYEAGQVKRHILNKVRKGELNTITKKECFILISQRPKLGIKTDRTLWEKERKEYLDTWYSKLIDDIYSILNSSEDILSNLTENTKDLHEKINYQNLLIQEYKVLIKQLRIENENLRLKTINKYGNID